MLRICPDSENLPDQICQVHLLSDDGNNSSSKKVNDRENSAKVPDCFKNVVHNPLVVVNFVDESKIGLEVSIWILKSQGRVEYLFTRQKKRFIFVIY